MTTPARTAGDHQMDPETDQTVLIPDELASGPTGAMAAGDTPSADPTAPEYPDTAGLGSAAAKPGGTGRADPVTGPAVSAPGADSGPPRPSPAAAGSTSAGARWHEIQAMFVDDPRSSAELAAGLAGDSADAVVASVRERQRALLSAWQGDDAGTEELRIAIQQYRAFWNRLEDLLREA